MPTFVHGKGAAIMFGQQEISAYFNSVDTPGTRDKVETSTFGASAKTYLPSLRDGSVALGGLWDQTAGAIDAILGAVFSQTADTPLTTGVAGYAIGNRAILANVLETKYDVKAPVGGVVSIAADLQPDGGLDMNGVWQHNLQAETVTGNSTSVDGGAPTTNGWAANLHVTAVAGTGSPSLASKIQDSADNSTFADLASAAFASVTTAATSQQITGTGTVRRYTRELHTIAGTGPSYTYAVALARR